MILSDFKRKYLQTSREYQRSQGKDHISFGEMGDLLQCKILFLKNYQTEKLRSLGK